MSDVKVGTVTIFLSENDEGKLVAAVHVVKGVETDAEMIVALAAGAMVDWLNGLQEIKTGRPNRSVRRAASSSRSLGPGGPRDA